MNKLLCSSILTISLIYILSMNVVCNAQESEAGTTNAAPSSALKKCYQCNQNDNPNCADPFVKDALTTVECKEGENYCRKTVQTIEGVKSVIRQCARTPYKANTDNCYKTAGKATQHVCYCQTDECNSAINQRFSSITFIALALMILKYIF